MPRWLYLVRHGEVHNPARVRYGRLPGFSLSERGRAQAEAAAQLLLAQSPLPTVLWSSPLERALETAAPLEAALGLRAKPEEKLLENSSRLDGLPRGAGPRALLGAVLRGHDFAEPERPLAVAARMREAARELLALVPEGGAAALVSHQTPLRLLVASALHDARAPGLPWAAQLDAGRARPMECAPGSVTVLAWSPGSVELRAYHAPPVR